MKLLMALRFSERSEMIIISASGFYCLTESTDFLSSISFNILILEFLYIEENTYFFYMMNDLWDL